MTTGELEAVRSAVSSAPRLRTASDALGIALVVAFCTLPAAAQFSDAFPGVDEAFLLSYAEQVLSGRLPGRDFYSVYGPGGSVTLAGIFWVTGPSVMAERALGLAYHVGVATGVTQLTSPYGRTASHAAGITSALVMLPVGLPAYSWFGGLALVVWSLALVGRPSGHRPVVLAGVLGGFVGAWRLEMLVLLVAAAPLLWRNDLAKRYLLGLVLGLAPMAAYVVWVGPAVFLGAVTGRAELDAQLEWSPLPIRVGLVLLVVAICALAGVPFLRLRGRRVAVAHACLAILLLPQALQRTDIFHLVYVISVVGPLTVAAAVLLRSRLDKPTGNLPRHRSKALVGVALGTLVMTTTVWLLVGTSIKTTAVSHSGRSVFVSVAEAPRLTALVGLISHTVPRGSRIFIGAEDMSVPGNGRLELYHLLPEYRADSYYLELPPDVGQAPNPALLRDVLRADALILTDTPRWYSKRLYPHIGVGTMTVNRAIASHFCPAGSVPPETVYLKCDPE